LELRAIDRNSREIVERAFVLSTRLRRYFLSCERPMHEFIEGTQLWLQAYAGVSTNLAARLGLNAESRFRRPG
jgi:hypothetical protein